MHHLVEKDGRTSAHDCPVTTNLIGVTRRGLITIERKISTLVKRLNGSIRHGVGSMNQLETPIVNSTSRHTKDHQRDLEGGERVQIDIQLSVLVEVPPANDDPVTILVDLVNRLGGQTRLALAFVLEGGRQRNQIDDLAEGLVNKMLHAQINGVIANIESLGADAEQIDHPTLLYG